MRRQFRTKTGEISETAGDYSVISLTKHMKLILGALFVHLNLTLLSCKESLFLFFSIQTYEVADVALLARQLCEMNQVKSSKIKGPGVAEATTYVLFETLDLI